MPKYAVEVTTAIARRVTVEAASPEDAESAVREMVAQGTRFFPRLPLPWVYSEAYDVDRYDVVREIPENAAVTGEEEF